MLGLGGFGWAAYHGERIWRAQRLQKLFFDTLAALRLPEPEAPDLLAALQTRAPEQSDGALLAAAYAAAWGRYDEAHACLDRASKQTGTVGALSGGLVLQFPGLPSPVQFHASVAWVTIQAVKAHLLTLAGRPRDALQNLVPQSSSPLDMFAVAEAREALGDLQGALSAFRDALAGATHEPSVSRFLRYRIALLLEFSGAPSAAAQEYDRLLSDGDYQDAASRRATLGDREEAERQARERERTEAERLAREAERLAREEAERQERQRIETERLAREAERDARQKAEREAREKAERRGRERMEAERLAHEEAEQSRLERMEARRQAREETERQERQRIEAEREALRRREEEIVRDTLGRVAAAKGSAGRRAALRYGLSALGAPAARERLKAECSRIEVEAVLDKVDGLKTKAAKRRNLEAALADIRDDDVPDELQADQIQWLEQALAELERS